MGRIRQRLRRRVVVGVLIDRSRRYPWRNGSLARKAARRERKVR